MLYLPPLCFGEYIQKKWKSSYEIVTCNSLFTAAQYTTWVPVKRGVDEEALVHLLYGILQSHHKQCNSIIASKIVPTKDHYAQ